jgi:hypothetical protein
MYQVVKTKLLGAVLAVVIVCSVTSLADGAPTKKPSNPLRKHDRETLIAERLNHQTHVTLVVAATPGRNAVLARYAASLGAEVRYRDDDVDYLRLYIAIDAVEELAASPDLYALNVNTDNLVRPTSVEPEVVLPLSGLSQEAHQDLAPGPGSPADNPYVPTRDIGAVAFMSRHPNFDGRGVAICVHEGTPADMLAPELQSAKNLEGKPVRKMIDVIDSMDPTLRSSRSWSRVDMSERINVTGGQFVSGGKTYTVPHDGLYRFGIYYAWPFEEAPFAKKHFNRSGISRDESSRYGVLWEDQSNTVWVDVDQNYDFRNDSPLTDYNVRFDLGQFGKDDPATPERESIGFYLLAHPGNDFIDINPLFTGHTTQTTSVAAGKGFFGGQINGVAPYAQVVSTRAGRGVAGDIEAISRAMKSPKVDLVTVQLAYVVRMNDGGSVLSTVLDRLIAKYKKPIIESAGNQAGLNAVMESGSGSREITVGAYGSSETFKADYGINVKRGDYVADFSSGGPRKDGGFKPDVIAPGFTLTADNFSGINGNTTPKGVSWKLPPGYFVSYGTSFSAPMVAGATALLISAAKQSGVHYDAARLKWALKSTARLLPEWRPYEQGAGLIRVENAWQALQSAPDLYEIATEGSVRGDLSQFLKSPGIGSGIYEREGWSAGQVGYRVLTFVRTTGPVRPIRYDLRWVGDDSFTSARTIALPLNRPVHLRIRIGPRSAGVHSAVLNLDDAQGFKSVHAVMSTIVAAEQFTPDNSYTVDRVGRVDYPSHRSYFVHVPEKTSALDVVVKAAAPDARIRLAFRTPAGAGRQSEGKSSAAVFEASTARYIVNPEPGVWEVIVDNGNDGRWVEQPKASQIPVEFHLTASVYGLEIRAKRSSSSDLPVTITSRLGRVVGKIMEAPLASRFETTREIALGAPLTFEIAVPEGATKLISEVRDPSETAADVDLYLYKCEKESCRLWSYSANAGATESIIVDKPAAGRWVTVIDPVAVPEHKKLSIRYADAFTLPAFGTSSASPDRMQDNMWTREIVFSRGSAQPSSPRQLGAFIQVAISDAGRSDSAAVAGLAVLPINSVPTSSSAGDHKRLQP